jgi:hypothetical protein
MAHERLYKGGQKTPGGSVEAEPAVRKRVDLRRRSLHFANMSHCRFSKSGANSLSESGIEWMNSRTKRDHVAGPQVLIELWSEVESMTTILQGLSTLPGSRR